MLDCIIQFNQAAVGLWEGRGQGDPPLSSLTLNNRKQRFLLFLFALTLIIVALMYGYVESWWYFGTSTEAELRQTETSCPGSVLHFCELFVKLLESRSVNKASLECPEIISSKITCISILFWDKLDDLRVLETCRGQTGDESFAVLLSLHKKMVFFKLNFHAKLTMNIFIKH